MIILILIVLLIFIYFFLKFLNDHSLYRYYRPLFTFPQIILMFLSGFTASFYLNHSSFEENTLYLLLAGAIIFALISIVMGFKETGVLLGITTAILTIAFIIFLSFIFYTLAKAFIFLGPGVSVIFLLICCLKKKR